MTRSTKRRQNNSARYIAGFAWPGYALSVWRDAHGAFTPADAERYARLHMARVPFFDAGRLDEVNWPYAAELMNRMAA
jgi:hypothetical protein